MRLRILELPTTAVGEVVETPFAFVVDQADGYLPDLPAWQEFVERCGARAVLFTAFEVELS